MHHELVMYGGAFNPPHLDHTGENGVLGTLLRSVSRRVLLIPTGIRSDKDYENVTPRERLTLLEYATEAYGDTVEIDPRYILGHHDTTTLAQARYLREKYGRDIPQVFGSDVAPFMQAWDPSLWVAQKLPKIFLLRDGYPFLPSWLENYECIPFQGKGFSSTLVRREVRAVLDGKSTTKLSTMVHDRVCEYILREGLFSDGRKEALHL